MHVFNNHIGSFGINRHLALTSMSSSRVFMDADVQPTRDYLEW